MIINENRKLNSKIILQTKELEWANIYHDSVRGKKPIEELGLNVGRWAGNYSFFYVLNRILFDHKPNSILEFGLGESTKFISTFLRYYMPECEHVVIEQSTEWFDEFKNRFELTDKTSVIFCPLVLKNVKGFEVNSYLDFETKIASSFDFYVVDGPFGSPRFSRYDIVLLVEKFQLNNEFIILLDDTNRRGEVDTLNEIIKILSSKGINSHLGHYQGNKRVSIISSDKYKYLISL